MHDAGCDGLEFDGHGCAAMMHHARSGGFADGAASRCVRQLKLHLQRETAHLFDIVMRLQREEKGTPIY